MRHINAFLLTYSRKNPNLAKKSTLHVFKKSRAKKPSCGKKPISWENTSGCRAGSNSVVAAVRIEANLPGTSAACAFF